METTYDTRGKHIQTIELYYCTALGLGVLPKPPGFDLDQVRKTKPFAAKNMTPGLHRCL
jgi:hypothetical protein